MFEHLEARVNAATMKKLANATAMINGQAVRVIHDSPYKVGQVGVVGMGAAAPNLVIANSDIPAGFLGMDITVNGAAWLVAERGQGEGLPYGLTEFVLEKA